MKQFFTFYLLLAFTVTLEAQDIFISDFSFWENDAPIDWNGSKTDFGPNGSSFTQVSEGVAVGDFAVRLTNTAIGPRQLATQALTVEAGKLYEITFNVRGTGEIRTGLFDDRAENAGFVYSNYVNINSPSWFIYTQTVTAVENTSAAEFLLSVRNTTGDLHLEVDFVAIADVTDFVENLTIAQIQIPLAGTGSPYEGFLVRTSGIVTAIAPTGYFIQDAPGAWNGLFIFDNLSNISQGDLVEVVGSVEEYLGWTQLVSVSFVDVVSQGNELPAPAVITTAQVNQEMYESVLIRINGNCTVAPDGFNEWEINDGSGNAMVGDLMYAAAAELGAEYTVTGPVSYSFNRYKVQPREAGDVEINTSVVEENDAISTHIYPVPARHEVSMEFSPNAINAPFAVYDITGSLVRQGNLSAQILRLDVSSWSAGMYIIEIRTNDRPTRQRFQVW